MITRPLHCYLSEPATAVTPEVTEAQSIGHKTEVQYEKLYTCIFQQYINK